MSSNFVGGSYDNKGNGFALLVVLFILLIIVGTAFAKNYY
ncbi:YjcZ family sporulation protein [Ureibacillus manganicus]|nr:YjcZ family sporulation protein [Ureibacillus manganicus]